MNKERIFTLGLVMFITGIIGGGLFAIANSLNIFIEHFANEPRNITCGIVLFVLFGVSAFGVGLICSVLFQKENKK